MVEGEGEGGKVWGHLGSLGAVGPVNQIMPQDDLNLSRVRWPALTWAAPGLGAVGTWRHVGLVPASLRREAHPYPVDHHSRSRLRPCLQLLEAS